MEKENDKEEQEDSTVSVSGPEPKLDEETFEVYYGPSRAGDDHCFNGSVFL